MRLAHLLKFMIKKNLDKNDLTNLFSSYLDLNIELIENEKIQYEY